jgi:hypothetical protein
LIITVIPIPGLVTMMAPGGRGEGVFNTHRTRVWNPNCNSLACEEEEAAPFKGIIEIFVFNKM